MHAMQAGALQSTDGAFLMERAIAGRKSVRRFHGDAVPEDVLTALIGAASRAPSAHNRQPWRFRILRAAAEKAALAGAMGSKLAADRARDGDDPEAIRQDVARSSLRINGAPVVIAVCLTLEEMDAYPDPHRAQAEFLMAVQSTAMAAQNLMLTAHAAGLGACWVCAPLFCPDIVAGALELPQCWRPQGLILLGRAAEPGRDRPRKAPASIAIGLAR